MAFRVSGSGFRINGLGFRVRGLGFRYLISSSCQITRFRILGSGLHAPGNTSSREHAKVCGTNWP